MTTCGKCLQPIAASEQRVACSAACGQQSHVACANLTPQQMKELATYGKTTWNCAQCLLRSQGATVVAVELPAHTARSRKKCCQLGFKMKSAAVLSAIIVILVIVKIVLSHMYREQYRSAQNDEEQHVRNLRKAGTLPFDVIKRETWQSNESTVSELPAMRLPVERLIAKSTGNDYCDTPTRCTALVRGLYTHSITELPQPGDMYNFLIGGDGRVYEWLGWNQTALEQNSTVLVGFIQPPEAKASEKQVRVLKQLLHDGMQRNLLSANYKILQQ